MNMNMNPTRVFVADDHPMVLAGLSHFFQRQSDIFFTGTAESFPQLYEALTEARPNVLVMDLNMPGDDYSHAITRIKAEFPWIKIVAYSQYEDADLVRNLRKLGAHGFLSKSVSSDELLRIVKTVQAGRREFPNPASMQVALAAVENNREITDDFKKRLNLSRREQQIVMLISRGLTSARISDELFISKHTVETHRKNILRKLNLNSSKELVRFAVIQGLAN